MIETSFRLEPLHHRHGFRAERSAQPIQLLDQVRDIAGAVGADEGPRPLRMEKAKFRAEPGAPGMTEKIDLWEIQRGADLDKFLDIALDRPQSRIVRPVRRSATKLIISDDRQLGGGQM